MEKQFIEQKIKEYLTNDLGVDTSTINNDTTLFSSGLLDSMNLLGMVSFIEQTFEVKISPLEVNLETFDTLTSLTAFIAAKKG